MAECLREVAAGKVFTMSSNASVSINSVELQYMLWL